MVSVSSIITGMTKTDALAPIIALEATVTGGRTLQAYKRGGHDEARERLIEETTGALVWLGGVKVLNDYVGDPILKKLFGANFDVGTDSVLRTPFKNFLKNNPNKRFTAKQIALIKATKVLGSVLIADAFIGLVVPPLNQKLTRNLRNKKNNNTNSQDKLELSNKQAKNPSFKGGGSLAAINVFTNAIENTNTGKLLSTDAGLISGRMYSARNKDERREIAIRDIGSIYFYMWAQRHAGNVLNFIETGRTTRLNPSTATSLDKYLNEFLAKNGGEMSVEDFRKAVLGKQPSEIKLPEGINFEKEELSSLTKFFNNFKKTKTEPLQAIKVSELKGVFESQPELWDRINKMSKLQPLREGESVITKQQIIDAINVCEINNPEFLDKMFSDFTGGKIDKKTGKYIEGASKNQYRYVSNSSLYGLKADMEAYIDDLCKTAKNGKINKDILKNAKNKNISMSGLNFVAGFVFAAAFLSTLIPKFQYWVTRKTTGENTFPGLYEFENSQKS